MEVYRCTGLAGGRWEFLVDIANLKEIKGLTEEFCVEVDDSDLSSDEKADLYDALEEILNQINWMLGEIQGQ